MAEFSRTAIATLGPVVSDATMDYWEGMSEQDVARFRAQAQECREQAERAASPIDKEAWLRVAGEWIKLAQEADARLRK
jgi:hypothetical protein